MPKFSQIASEYVRFLLEILNDSNHDYVLHELCQFAEYGSEGSILLLQTCLDYMNFYGRSMQDMQLKPEILSAVFRYLLSRPNFSTVFCESLRNSVIYEGFLQDFTNALHLSVAEKIGVGLALTDSENLEIKTSGQKFCMVQIEELYSNPSSVDSFEQIQNIIMFLHQSEDLDKHVDSFMQMVSLLHLKERSTSTLTPWLSDGLHEASALRNLDLFYESSENDFDAVLAEVERERSMADTVKELGYGCTVSVLHCTEVLSLFLPLTERTLSRIMSTIARIHTGLDDSQSTYITFCSALCSSAPSDLSCLSYWNVDVLVDSINQLAPGISWIHVMENLDHEGFYFPNEDAFSLFMSIYSHACQDPFPLHAICGYVWNNAEGQLSFLRYAVAAPPEIFTFRHAARQLAYVDAVHGHKLHQDHAFHAWLCLDLLEVLCQLAERGHAGSVRSLLEDPLNHCPEVLLVGMAHISTAFNLIQYEVSYTVFRMLVGDATKNGVILQLWNVNPKIVLRGFVDIHNSDSNIITRILGVCQALQILLLVLEMAPFRFSIRLAALASWKELINLEEWLNDNLMTYKDVFFEECLNFLKEMPLDPAQDVSDNPFQHSVGLLNVYLATRSAILKTLQSYTGKLTSCHLSEEIKKLHIASIHAHSKLQNFETTDSSTSEGCANDIEAEATSYVDQIFLGQVTIDTMVQMLARFKDSSEKREKSIFNFIIANLFEASKFFPKYPEKQLKIAAVLFGSLIKQRLLTHPLLGVALRAVLDALRKSTDSKMFVFGATALEQFVDRLVEWPQCCNHILQISHLRSTHPELITIVERARARTSSGHTESSGVNSGSTDQYHSSAQDTLENVEVSESMWHSMAANGAQPYQQLSSPLQLQQRHQGFLDDRHRASAALVSCTKPPAGQPSLVSMNDAAGSQKSLQTVLSQNVASATTAVSSFPGFRSSRVTSSMLKQNSYSTGFGSALNIETLVAAAEKRDTSIEAPASDIQDKILFMINNISSANIEVKAKEFIEILKEQYYPWFAQYMVMKRASIEPNFHDLYLKFMDKVNSKALNKEVVKATYENCKVLLSSDLIKSSSEERSLLKNLGSWLGKFTIGRNQVLRAKEIDPKALIVEAYEKGLMIAVIPFTSKILEPCQSSLAYRPPNPWTMAILSLLTEIYSLPNLKMNLKFDIEVLFKNLGVDMKDVEPSSLLKDRVREVEGNPDFSSKDVLLSQPQIAVDVSSGIISTLNQAELQSESVNSSHLGGHSNVLCQYTAPLHLASGQLMDGEKMTLLSLSDRHPSSQVLSQVSPSQTPFSVSQLPTPIHSLSSHFIVNQKLNALGLHLHFQRVVPLAMERAIKEIMSPIVHRSISIAIQTTRELVIKDYAMESDETRIHNAAHLMVESLAGSLAHVTCKEPLRSAISSQLRNSLQGLNISSELLEKAVQLVNNDNLDMGCMVIEKAAMAKATEAVDGEISQQLSLRRKHREVVGASYFDASNYTQGPMGVLPEALRPKPGHLSVSQQSVYEDFSRFPWENKSTETSNALSAVPPASSGASVSSGLPCTYGVTSGQLNSGLCSSMQVVQGFSVSKEPLDLISEDTDLSSAQLLSASCSRTGTITHIGEADGITQHGSEMNPLIASLPSTAAASEFYSVGPSSAAKVSRAATPSLPASSNMECPGSGMSEPLLTTGDALDKYQIIAHKLETLAAKDSRETEIQGVIAEVPEIILRCISRDEAALAVAQKVFKGLYENASNSLLVGAHLAILAAIRDVCKLVVKELTSWVIYSDEERKFNKDITVGLIRSELLNLAEYNLQMAKLIDAGRNKAATEFAISLLQTLVALEAGASVSELHNVVDALAKLAMRPGSPESLQQLVEIARNPSAGAASLSGFTVCKEDKARQSRDKKVPGGSLVGKEDYNNVEAMGADHAAFHEQVSGLFGEWFQICKLAGNDTACTHYISRLQQNGLLRGDDMSDRFFRLLMEIAVGHCRSFEMLSPGSLQSTQPSQHLPFLPIDAYAKLVFLILKYCAVDHGSNKVFLLPKILSVTVRVIQKDAEEKKASFNPRPYFRLLINWFLDIISPDPTLDGSSFQVLTSFANVFHALQPLKVPVFSFAWLELVSHRTFMPKLLTSNSQKGWPFVQRLLVDLFKFMEPYLRNAEPGELVHFLYKGTLRVLLVLLHDFPEFLCDYHFSFCDVIPPSCIQMRNVILSAFPRNMRLPDPSTPNLKIDLLPEIGQPPRILFEVDAALKAKQMKVDIDEYLRTRQQESSFLTELKQKLMLPQSEAAQSGTWYNVPLINSLVLYVGMQAIHQLHAYPPHKQSVAQTPMEGTLVSASMDIFQTLMADLDTEGRYLFLNAIANQLRYPNSHTHFFSFVLLYLFEDANQEVIQEQITRVLLERLIVNRPHPWGLLITFIELIKNPRYNFWNRAFTRCAPEIEKLFESVSRSCGGPKPVDESMMPGIPDNTH